MPALFGLWAAMNWSFFRSPFVAHMYQRLVLSDSSLKRRIGLSILAIAYLMRSHKQFGAGRLKLAVLLAMIAFAAAALTAPAQQVVAAVGAALLLVAAALTIVAGGHHDDGIGHRGGAVGYEGKLFENTVQAAEALIECDRNMGPLPDFLYLEIDVQETADGEVVLFHDATLVRAFPDIEASQIKELEAATGVAFSLLTVKDLTLAQLQSLPLGGREGMKVPTLQQYLKACVAAGLRRTLAVEVKRLQTDVARQQLLDLISKYLAEQGPLLDSDPVAVRHRCRQLGWAGVIAFPHLFPAAFGEYGSPEWRRWAECEFKRRGIPCRACHALWLTLIG